MYITVCYKYKKDEVVYIGNNVPEGCELLETMNILNAEENMELVRIEDSHKMGSSFWLRDGDSQENYKEVEKEKPTREVKDAE